MRVSWRWLPVALVVLVFAVVAYFFVWYYIPNVKIATSIAPTVSLSSVNIQDVESGKLSRYLGVMDALGRIPGTKYSAYTVKQFEQFSLADSGFGTVQLSEGDVHNVYSQNKLPYKFIAFFKTTIEGNVYTLAVQKWSLPRGQDRYVTYVMPLDKVSSDLLSTWNDALTNTLTVTTMPILHFVDNSSCMTITTNDVGLCAMFMKDQSANSAKMQTWVKSNSVPSSMGNGVYWMSTFAIPDFNWIYRPE